MFSRRSISDEIASAVSTAVDQTKLEHHLHDCAEYRRQTKERMDSIDGKLDTLHEQSLAGLRWQRTLLATVLVALLTFIGDLVIRGLH
jgi:hypothetical protein